MKQIPTPKELLELIKSSLFKDIDIECVLAMTSAQLDTFTLEQEERLLAAQPHGRLASWLSDLFWTADKEAILITTPHPWLDEGYELKGPKEMSDLNSDEYELAEWIIQLAALSHDLIVHAPFPIEILQDGLDRIYEEDEDNFGYKHKSLIEWIRSTPYRRIAALVCYQVLDNETNRAIRTNQAIQDFYAMECWRLHPDWQSLDDCEEFIRTAIDGMEQIEKHYDEGHAAGLNDEEIRVLDALYGFAPHEYLAEDFPRVRDLCKAANESLPDKPYVKSENGQREYARKMHEAFREIFAKYGTHYDPSDLTDLTPGYLDSWIYDKYYE